MYVYVYIYVYVCVGDLSRQLRRCRCFLSETKRGPKLCSSHRRELGSGGCRCVCMCV